MHKKVRKWTNGRVHFAPLILPWPPLCPPPLNPLSFAPALLLTPTRQSTPLSAPVESEYVPAMQGVHAVAPAKRQRAHTGFTGLSIKPGSLRPGYGSTWTTHQGRQHTATYSSAPPFSHSPSHLLSRPHFFEESAVSSRN